MLRQLASLTVLTLILLTPAGAEPALTDIEKQIDAGQFQPALRRLDELLSSDKANPHFLFYRARALAANGQRDEAIAQYEALIKAAPELPEPYNNLAVLYMQAGKGEQARNMLNKAMATHPAYAAIYQNLIAINTSKAQDAYARALQIQGKRQEAALREVNKLSLAEKLEPVASPSPAPLVTSAVTDNTVQPGLVYKAEQNQADKETVAVTKVVGTDAGFEQASAMLQAWAEAWASKKVEQYLHYYSDTYSPSDMTRQAWAAQRRERILRPKWIRVNLTNVMLKAQQGQQLTITLEQEYRADNYRDVTRKEFVLEQTSGEWRIIKERGLGYIAR